MTETITDEALQAVYETQAKDIMTPYEFVQVKREYTEGVGLETIPQERRPAFVERLTSFSTTRRTTLDECVSELRGKIHSRCALDALDTLAKALVPCFGEPAVRKRLRRLAEQI